MDNAESGVLLLHLVRIPELRNRAIEQLKTDDDLFSPLMAPVHHTMWQVLKDVHAKDPTAFVPRLIMQTELPKRLRELDDFRDYETEADSLMAFVYETPTDQISLAIGNQYLQQGVVEVARRTFMTKAEALYNPQDIAKFLAEVQGVYTPPSNRNTLHTPFMEIDKYLTTTPQVLTGMGPLDRVSGGGFHRKSVNGLLGPTGGGKTMTTYQIAVGQAKRQNNCLVMTYEQGIEGDIAQRLCSGIMEVDIKEIAKPFAQWSRAMQEEYYKKQPEFGPYIHIKDMTEPNQGCRGIFDIEDSFNALKDAGKEPVYIIVDWLKPLVIRYLVYNGLSVDDKMFRQTAYMFLDQCGQFAKEKDVIMLITHQLDTATSRASPKRKPVVTDASEFKAFSFNLDSCFLLGNRDKETNIAWLLSDKNRRGAPSELLVEMKGHLARFDEAGEYVADHKGCFIKRDAVMPDEVDSPESPKDMAADYMQ